MQPILSLGANGIAVSDMVYLRHAVSLAAPQLPFSMEWRVDAAAESADVLLLDVDTIYGHVDWLRAQSTGRALIALTSRPNGSHDHELARDAEPAVIEALLRQFESQAHARPSGGKAESDSASAHAPDSTKAAAPQARTMELPVIGAAAIAPRLAATRELPTLDAATVANAISDRTSSDAVPDEPAAPIEPAAPPRDSMSLLEWLRDADGIQGVMALNIDDHELIVDRTCSIYYGPASLKPLLPLSQRSIARVSWQALDAGALSAHRLGEAMPLARLLLLAGLGAFEGLLDGNLNAALPFRLPKWPQIEREFPRHMRIATALMKGPASVDELVTQTNLPYGEVADFLNGFVAAGFIEQVLPVAEPEVAPPAAGERLMGRLRAFGRKP